MIQDLYLLLPGSYLRVLTDTGIVHVHVYVIIYLIVCGLMEWNSICVVALDIQISEGMVLIPNNGLISYFGACPKPKHNYVLVIFVFNCLRGRGDNSFVFEMLVELLKITITILKKNS